ncbi:MAG: ribonuclease P protein component [Sulfurospirillum sp.]|nr:ribonuclease P protein component [Sulfurospirillum sp.]
MGSIVDFEKLTANSEFSKAYKQGKRWHTQSVVIFYKEDLEKKIGFTASKKVGNAVKRNFAKRRMRSLFFEFKQNLQDGIYVIVAKDQICTMPYESIKKEFIWAFKRLGVYLL